MTLTFDRAIYTNLLSQFTPKVIETEEEYEQTLAVVESLAFNSDRTVEQTALYKLLILLVEAYETENYPMSEASPIEVLNHILEASNTKPADLVGLIGSSSVVADIVNGTRAINEAEAKILSDRFNVSPNLFIG
ncbi:transcriptional regulator [Nodosilinea sp. LEGE 06152]|uniref:helix-turn-helix domain-containing protein n=1 Tax=Nodosilinea sp. LEGE 06152 TaxID=2777966 RepID=UPI00187DFA63|nr:transcriptional regulator [Nodosilinea sp. LEGE 06152]MBE9159625.1 transcriptional regulator [Nodosilinea sp. LEGE 06152]